MDTANELYTWGWRASVAGAVATSFGVALLFWGTRARDHEFEQQIASLNFEAGGARERAGKLEERAAGLEKEAADLKLQITWRRLTKDQHDKISATLRSGPQQRINVSYASADPEATLYALDLMKSFRDGGAEVTSVGRQTVGVAPELGIGLHTRSFHEVDAVMNALSAAQVQFEVRPPYPQGLIGNPGVQVYVGSKPSP